MAYSPPNHDAVDANFTDSGYSPPAHNAVNANFTEGAAPPAPFPFILGFACAVAAPDTSGSAVDAAWATDIPDFERLGLTGQFAIDGISVGPARGLGLSWQTDIYDTEHSEIDASWILGAGESETCKLDTAYAVTPILSEGHRGLGIGWRTSAYGAEALQLTAYNLVQGVATYTGRLGQQWAVEEATHELSGLQAAWNTAGVARDDTAVDVDWAVASPESEGLFAGCSWSTQIWAVDVLQINLGWLYMQSVGNDLEFSSGYIVSQEMIFDTPIGSLIVGADCVFDSRMTQSVGNDLAFDSAIEGVDQVAAELIFSSAIGGATVILASQPTVTVRGETIPLETAEIAEDEGQFAWTCQLALSDPAQYSLFDADEEFTITLGTEQYTFIRDDRRFSRTGPTELAATISGISPAAQFADPRADKITRNWDDATLASAVVTELLGTVDWRIVDWAIPAGQLNAQAQTPMAIAQQVAKAAGAVIESNPDGSLYVRYLWPVSVPVLDLETPDQVFSDSTQAFNLEEESPQSQIVNRIRILNASDTAGGTLVAEIDTRPAGFNAGRSSFQPGDQPAFLIFKSDDVAIESIAPSAGSIQRLDSGEIEITQFLEFAGSSEASLQKPTEALDSWKWLGNDLGTPELADNVKVQVPTSGVGVLKVVYRSSFEARRLSGVPLLLNGESEYEVEVLVEGEQT